MNEILEIIFERIISIIRDKNFVENIYAQGFYFNKPDIPKVLLREIN